MINQLTVSESIANILLTKKTKQSTSRCRNSKPGSIIIDDSYFTQRSTAPQNIAVSGLTYKSRKYTNCTKLGVHKMRNICYRQQYFPSLDVNTKDESIPLFLYDSKHPASKCNKTSCMQSTNTISPSKLSHYLYHSSLRNYRIMKTYEGTKLGNVNWYGSKNHRKIKLASINKIV